MSLATVGLLLLLWLVAADVAGRGAGHDGGHVEVVHVDRPEAGGGRLGRHGAEAHLQMKLF